MKTSTTTKACEAAISTPQAVDFDYDCANPGTCSTGNYMTIGASTVGASATGLNLSFDANGNANLGNISYQDVGSITLKASATVGGVTLAGTLSGSGGSPFVVKPASFTVSQSACADGTLNTVSQSAPATGNAKFCRAGQNFTAKVTALNAAGNATPNYGNETPAEKVGLGSWGVQLPSGGAPGTLPTATFTGAPASGTLTANATSVWNEVGILKATAAVGDANYLGAGNISNTVYFGRFYPDHFDTTITPATGCSGFVYAGQSATVLGQPFTVTTTAKSGASTPTTTTNYTSAGGFAKNIDLSLSAGGSVGKLYVGNTQTGTNAIPATTFVAGIGEVNFAAAVGKISYSFDTFPTSPTPITLHGVDADTGTALIASTDAGTTAHAGRLRLLNAYGSDLLPLRVPFQTEYYNASTTWTISNNDSCTTLPSAAIALGSRTPPGVGSSVSSVVPVASGVGTIVLAKPSSAGTIDLAAGLTGSATAAITASSACLSSWSNGPNTTTGAALDYLTSNWCGSVFTKLPAARIKFGSPKAPFIYQRETY